ncbi:MAG: hypothetical protein WC979_04650 [Candidatus Pacearchaeota archaeon]|jgi:hypothetical protein
MKWQLIALIIVGIFLISGIALSQFTMANEKTKAGCDNCNKKCTKEKNCGNENCSALKTGICNCGK